MDILIKNGYLIDPKGKKEGRFDILVSKGKVEKISKKIKLSKICLSLMYFWISEPIPMQNIINPIITAHC